MGTFDECNSVQIDLQIRTLSLIVSAYVERETESISDILGGLNTNLLLKRGNDRELMATKKRLLEEKDRIDSDLSIARKDLKGHTESRNWVDWVQSFGDELAANDQLTDAERKIYISGLVERIDVRYLSETREHELLIHFRLPIVGDGMEWVDPEHKKKGYNVAPGKNESTLLVKKKDKRG